MNQEEFTERKTNINQGNKWSHTVNLICFVQFLHEVRSLQQKRLKTFSISTVVSAISPCVIKKLYGQSLDWLLLQAEMQRFCIPPSPSWGIKV